MEIYGCGIGLNALVSALRVAVPLLGIDKLSVFNVRLVILKLTVRNESAVVILIYKILIWDLIVTNRSLLEHKGASASAVEVVGYLVKRTLGSVVLYVKVGNMSYNTVALGNNINITSVTCGGEFDKAARIHAKILDLPIKIGACGSFVLIEIDHRHDKALVKKIVDTVDVLRLGAVVSAREIHGIECRGRA